MDTVRSIWQIHPFSCVLIFFDDDKKDVTASTLFEIHHGKIIMVSSQDFLGVPPGKKSLAKISDKG